MIFDDSRLPSDEHIPLPPVWTYRLGPLETGSFRKWRVYLYYNTAIDSQMM